MIRLTLAIAGVVAALGHGMAAPLPPFAPVDVCGAIVSYAWQPAFELPPVPGASGTLGRTRRFPARFRVVIKDYGGIDAQTARHINGLLGFEVAAGEALGQLLLMIASPDPTLLMRAQSLCVYEFHIAGDEGGTWTSHRELVLDPGGSGR